MCRSVRLSESKSEMEVYSSFFFGRAILPGIFGGRASDGFCSEFSGLTFDYL